MTEPVKVKLCTNESNTSGWTAIKRDTARPVSYIREISPTKVEPPVNIRTLIMIENGAQCILIMPFLLDNLQYYETHEVQVQLGDASKSHPSTVVGSRCRISGAELNNWEASPDKRDLQIIFKPGDKEFDILLGQDGTACIKRV